MQQTLEKIPVFIIGGPTASGKSKLALHWAKKNNGVIINGDSMQVYNDLPILTAQPNAIEKMDVPHKLYGTLSGNQPCSVAKWQKIALKAIEAVWKSGKKPIVVGGSGLYLQSLVRGLSDIPDIPTETRTLVRNKHQELGTKDFHKYLSTIDPLMGKRLHENDQQRIMRAAEVMLTTNKSLAHWQATTNCDAVQHLQCSLIVLLPPRAQLHQNSAKRLEGMISAGAIDEVKAIRKKRYDNNFPIMKALGVTELSAYLEKNISLQEALDKTLLSTQQYIKRQSTLFRNQFPQARFINTPEEAN